MIVTVISKLSLNPLPRLFSPPLTPFPPECALGLMWSDSPAHCEFTAGPSRLPAEANRYRVRKPAAAVSILNTASIASNNVKLRRERACDLCRRRKTKCDGPSAPDNVCSHCVQNNQPCTYLCAYMRILLSLHVSHPPLAKPLAQEVHQKRMSPSLSWSVICSILPYTPPLVLAMSLASRTVWRRWNHYSRECVSRESISTGPF